MNTTGVSRSCQCEKRNHHTVGKWAI